MESLLADAAAKSVLLLLMTAIACSVLRSASASTRHFLWVVSLAMLLALPALAMLLPPAFIWHLPADASAWVPAAPESRELATATEQAGAARPLKMRPRAQLLVDDEGDLLPMPGDPGLIAERPAERVEPNHRAALSSGSLLLTVWGIGAGLMLLPLVVGTWAGFRLRGTFPAVRCGVLHDALTAVAGELRMTPPVLHVSPGNAMPMVWGVLRGHLLLPDAANAWEAGHLQAVLLHELAHLRRRDPLSMVVGQLARAAYWFNPLAWWAVSQMRVERERACDDYVLRRDMKPSDYAALLLELTANLCPAGAASVALAMADAPRLEGRLRTILDPHQNRRVVTGGAVAATLLAAVAATVSLSLVRASDEPPASPAPSSPAEPVATESASMPPVAPESPPAGTTEPDQAENAKLQEMVTKLTALSQDKFRDMQPGELAGIVFDEQFQPLAGVQVDAWTFQAGNETTTDANGAFRLKVGDDDPNVEIRYSKPGYSPMHLTEWPVGEFALMRLDKKTWIEGTVRDSAGKPVARATIKGVQGEKHTLHAVIPGPTTLTTTDSAGKYRMYVFPDTYDIQVSVPGVGVSRTTGLEVAHGEAKPLDIGLKPAVRFEARVVDATTRQPVEKVVLWKCFDASVLGVSDAEGKIVIDGLLPGEFEFNVGQGEPESCSETPCYRHGILGRWWSTDAVHEHQRREIERDGWQRNFDDLTFNLSVGMPPVTIEVERGVTFSGHVYDPDGKPVEGATVAPAKTGSGNSLTGDTRYSTRTGSDGSYRVVMPAGNGFQYNLMAHDGDYSEWRNWANTVSDPLRTKPGQSFDNFDFKLSRPATVRGRLVIDGDRIVGDREVTAQAADLRENRYYDPTVKVKEDGSFELKFIRPGRQRIQLKPRGTVVEVDLKEGQVLEGVELRGEPDRRSITSQMKNRTFRVKILDSSGLPAAGQQIRLNTDHPLSLNFYELAGDRDGLEGRLRTSGNYPATDAEGHIDLPGGNSLFGEYDTEAMIVAIDAVQREGAIGLLHADSKSPETTLRMAPLQEVAVSVSTEALPPTDEAISFRLESRRRSVVYRDSVTSPFALQLPPGDFALKITHPLAIPETVNFTVKPDGPPPTLPAIRLRPSPLAKLLGQPTPELRSVEEWRFGDAVRMADLRDRVVILAFWDRSDHGWNTSIPTLKKLRASYPETEVVIIGVFNHFWLDQLPRSELWGGQDLPFRVALVDRSRTEFEGIESPIQGRVMADYGVTRCPTTLLIDKRGNVASLLHADDFEGTKQQIDSLLGK